MRQGKEKWKTLIYNIQSVLSRNKFFDIHHRPHLFLSNMLIDFLKYELCLHTIYTIHTEAKPQLHFILNQDINLIWLKDHSEQVSTFF